MTGKQHPYPFKIPLDALSAVKIARGAERPLLVTGEAGCGKTELAYALAARFTEDEGKIWYVIRHTASAQSEALDLYRRLDLVQRLADAQDQSPRETSRNLDIENYVWPGDLWWAFDPADAERFVKRLREAGRKIGQDMRPFQRADATGSKQPASIDKPDDWPRGVVLLIDEIDKADPSFPNALLEALGDYSFEIPELGARKRYSLRRNAPGDERHYECLIVITSNSERELSDPLLRRVIEYRMDSAYLDRKDDPEEIVDRLLAAFGYPDEKVVEDQLLAALGVEKTGKKWGTKNDGLLTHFFARRKQCAAENKRKPSLAELVDAVRAMKETKLTWEDVVAVLFPQDNDGSGLV